MDMLIWEKCERLHRLDGLVTILPSHKVRQKHCAFVDAGSKLRPSDRPMCCERCECYIWLMSVMSVVSDLCDVVMGKDSEEVGRG